MRAGLPPARALAPPPAPSRLEDPHRDVERTQPPRHQHAEDQRSVSKGRARRPARSGPRPRPRPRARSARGGARAPCAARPRPNTPAPAGRAAPMVRGLSRAAPRTIKTEPARDSTTTVAPRIKSHGTRAASFGIAAARCGVSSAAVGVALSLVGGERGRAAGRPLHRHDAVLLPSAAPPSGPRHLERPDSAGPRAPARIDHVVDEPARGDVRADEPAELLHTPRPLLVRVMAAAAISFLKMMFVPPSGPSPRSPRWATPR